MGQHAPMLNRVATRNLKSFPKSYPGLQIDRLSVITLFIADPSLASWIIFPCFTFDNGECLWTLHYKYKNIALTAAA